MPPLDAANRQFALAAGQASIEIARNIGGSPQDTVEAPRAASAGVLGTPDADVPASVDRAQAEPRRDDRPPAQSLVGLRPPRTDAGAPSSTSLRASSWDRADVTPRGATARTEPSFEPDRAVTASPPGTAPAARAEPLPPAERPEPNRTDGPGSGGTPDAAARSEPPEAAGRGRETTGEDASEPAPARDPGRVSPGTPGAPTIGTGADNPERSASAPADPGREQAIEPPAEPASEASPADRAGGRRTAELAPGAGTRFVQAPTEPEGAGSAGSGAPARSDDAGPALAAASAQPEGAEGTATRAPIRPERIAGAEARGPARSESGVLDGAPVPSSGASADPGTAPSGRVVALAEPGPSGASEAADSARVAPPATDAPDVALSARRTLSAGQALPASQALPAASPLSRTEAVTLSGAADSASPVGGDARKALVDPALLPDWTAPASLAIGGQVERAGIIASFILNAAMIPGWPPPLPFAPSPETRLLGLMPKHKAPSEGDVLAYIETCGVKPSGLARLRDLLAGLAKSRRMRILLGLAVLLSSIGTVLELVEEELARLAGDAGSEEAEVTAFRPLIG